MWAIPCFPVAGLVTKSGERGLLCVGRSAGSSDAPRLGEVEVP